MIFDILSEVLIVVLFVFGMCKNIGNLWLDCLLLIERCTFSARVFFASVYSRRARVVVVLFVLFDCFVIVIVMFVVLSSVMVVVLVVMCDWDGDGDGVKCE